MSSYKDHVCLLDSVGSNMMCGRRHDVWQKTETSWHCARAGSSRMISDVPICLSLISHVALAASVLSNGTKVSRKTHLVAFICKEVGVLFSLPLVLAHQNEKAWRNSLFSERGWLPKAPPTWVAISIMGREGDRSSLLRCLGSDYYYLCPSSPPELHTHLLQTENTFAITHQKNPWYHMPGIWPG